MKDIYVCADDFGLTEGASRAIIELAQQRAISCASCVVDGSSAVSHAQSLLASIDNCAIGLHLNLTENPNPSLNASLKSWILRSFLLGTISYDQMAQEVRRQLMRFEDLFGRQPDYVDGHEHVHQFPVVRDVLMQCVGERYKGSVAIRSTLPQTSRGFKASVIATLGGRALHKKLVQCGVPTNMDFAGVYDFTTRIPYTVRMEQWLASLSNQAMLMCHPESKPSSSTARVHEYEFFLNSRWREMLERYDLRLVPFRAHTK